MKKITLTILSFIFLLMGGISLHQAQAQGACVIENAYFFPVKGGSAGATTKTSLVSNAAGARVGSDRVAATTSLNIKSTGCTDGLTIFIKGMRVETENIPTEDGEVKVFSRSEDPGSIIVNIDDERAGTSEDKGIQNREDPTKALITTPDSDGWVRVYYSIDPSGCTEDDADDLSDDSIADTINAGKLPFDCFFYPEIVYNNTLVHDGSDYFVTARTAKEIVDHFLKPIEVEPYYESKISNPVLLANCDGACDDYDWDLLGVESANNANCKINSASFSEFSAGTSITGKTTKLTIDHENCFDGFDVQLYYVEPDMIFDDIYEFSDSEIDGIWPDDNYFIPPASGPLLLNFRTSEDTCYEVGGSNLATTRDADCKIGLRISDRIIPSIGRDALAYFNSKEWLIGVHIIGTDVKNFEDGVIFAECNLEDGPNDDSTDCDVFGDDSPNWELISSNARNSEENVQFIPNEITYDVNNPCYLKAEVIDGISLPERYDPNCYELLAPIPGIEINADGEIDDQFRVTEDSRTGESRISIKDISKYQLGSFINKLFQIAVAILGVVAVIMIIIAGVEYMTTEAIYNKGEAKKKIASAISGLILSLGIFVILNTINPQLLEINFGENLKVVELQNDPDTPAGITSAIVASGDRLTTTSYTLPSDLKSATSLYCPGSGGSAKVSQIVNSFKGNVSYRYGGKGGHLPSGKIYDEGGKDRDCKDGTCNLFCPANTFCIDCSGFVSHVLQCAGLVDKNIGGTSTIFKGSEQINFGNSKLDQGIINGVALVPGDLIGKGGSHVAVYIGDGRFAESTPANLGRESGNAVQTPKMSERRKSWKFTSVRRLNTL